MDLLFQMCAIIRYSPITEAETTRYASSVPILIISTNMVSSKVKASTAPMMAKKYIAFSGICVFWFTSDIHG